MVLGRYGSDTDIDELEAENERFRRALDSIRDIADRNKGRRGVTVGFEAIAEIARVAVEP